MNAKKQDLMLLYNLPAFADNDVGAFLNGVARINNFLKKVCVTSGFISLADAI
jgi:hypothetical protein